jgi:glycosyltransferase involved in cell wall biosynthesis
VLYRYGVSAADRIIVQTQSQQWHLLEGFGRSSTVIPMPCPDAAGHRVRSRRLPETPGRVLWLGRLCPPKRPDRVLTIARACPELQFDLVGPAQDAAYTRPILDEAARIPNLAVHGPATRDRVGTFFDQAVALCCTSDFEGFPNTFIEAWSHGVPIVSMFDPDGLLARHGLGITCRSDTDIVDALRVLVRNRDRRQDMSDTVRRYYLATHAIDRVMPQFERVFFEAAGARHATAPAVTGTPSRPRAGAC